MKTNTQQPGGSIVRSWLEFRQEPKTVGKYRASVQRDCLLGLYLKEQRRSAFLETWSYLVIWACGLAGVGLCFF
jgi:hypothetical protein